MTLCSGGHCIASIDWDINIHFPLTSFAFTCRRKDVPSFCHYYIRMWWVNTMEPMVMGTCVKTIILSEWWRVRRVRSTPQHSWILSYSGSGHVTEFISNTRSIESFFSVVILPLTWYLEWASPWTKMVGWAAFETHEDHFSKVCLCTSGMLLLKMSFEQNVHGIKWLSKQ